jgi:hypothetical protein
MLQRSLRQQRQQRRHEARQRYERRLRSGRGVYPIELDANDIDTLQRDLGHCPDVSLRKLDPLLPAKHRQ